MKVHYIELLGKKHPLCFSMAAAEELDEHFGGLDKMADALTSKDIKVVAKATDKVLMEMLKAGRIYAGAMGEELPPAIPCKPSDILDPREGRAISAIFAALKGDSARKVRTQGNAEATQGS